MDKELYWLWLSLVKGIGVKKRKILLDIFKTPEEIWKSSDNVILNIKQLSDKDKFALINSRNEHTIKKYVDEMNDKNIKYYSYYNKYYPYLLKNIYDPPLIIYVKGNLVHSNLNLAFVGSRKCTDYGKAVAFNYAKDVAERGFTVISGMARGIDSYSHKGALAAKGNTIAVLGCGLDICYPKENYYLKQQIEQCGAVISEYPLGTKPMSYNFPRRNRIISGLSSGIVVVEAANKSGSLITADQGLEQGRNVYAVPGNIYSKYSGGTNNLIKQGAKILTSVEDILEDYQNIYVNKINKNLIKSKQKLEKYEKMIYDYLSLEPKYIDDISRNLNISIQNVQHTLTMLELKDYIEQLPNKRFIKKVL